MKQSERRQLTTAPGCRMLSTPTQTMPHRKRNVPASGPKFKHGGAMENQNGTKNTPNWKPQCRRKILLKNLTYWLGDFANYLTGIINTSWVDITWSNRLTGLTMRPKRDLTGCTSPGPDWLEGVSCLFPPWMMVEGADKQSRTEVTELAWWCKTKMNMFIEQFDYFTILQDFTFNCYANSIY